MFVGVRRCSSCVECCLFVIVRRRCLLFVVRCLLFGTRCMPLFVVGCLCCLLLFPVRIRSSSLFVVRCLLRVCCCGCGCVLLVAVCRLVGWLLFANCYCRVCRLNAVGWCLLAVACCSLVVVCCVVNVVCC